MSGVRISHHPPSSDLPPLPELWILRHGETAWNREGRWQGRLDSPLTARGAAQARALGAMLRRLGPGPRTHAILASPLGRAARTAELAFGPGVARPEPALMEIDVGRWSGRRIADVLATAGLPPEPDMLTLYSAAPGGEGFAALAVRCAGLLRRLDGPAILVGHGIAGRMIRTLALGLPLGALSDLPGAQGGAFRIRDGHEEVAWPEPRDGPVA